jgi:hypothetical protein
MVLLACRFGRDRERRRAVGEIGVGESGFGHRDFGCLLRGSPPRLGRPAATRDERETAASACSSLNRKVLRVAGSTEQIVEDHWIT